MKNDIGTVDIEYNPNAPLVEFDQNILNSCCLSTLASRFTSVGEINSARAIVMKIGESLYC